MDMNAFAESNPGKMMARVERSLGRSDLFLFMGDALPKQMKKPMALLSDEGGRIAKGKLAACLFLGSEGESAYRFRLSSDGIGS